VKGLTADPPQPQQKDKAAPAAPTALEAAKLWDLVPRFCRVHDLPLSKTFLQQLAAANDPFMFLFFAQSHQYPATLLLHIIEDQVANVSILEHLRGVLDAAITGQPLSHADDEEKEKEKDKEKGGAEDGKYRKGLYSSLGLKADDPHSTAREYVTLPLVRSDDLFDIAFACQKTRSVSPHLRDATPAAPSCRSRHLLPGRHPH